MRKITLQTAAPRAKPRHPTKRAEVEFIRWGRAVFSIYLIASITFRLAFIPDFKPNLHYLGFAVLDLLATTFFAYEAMKLARRLLSQRSPRSVLPAYESPKDDRFGHDCLRGIGEYSDSPPPRSISTYWRVFFHFLSTFPFEYLSMILFGEDSATNYYLLNRLLRLWFLPNYIKDVSPAIETEQKSGHIGAQSTGIRRAIWFFFAMALAGHLCGCGFFFVARCQALEGVSLTWPEVAGVYSIDEASIVEGQHQIVLTMKSTVADAYISSLYWAYITMITTGFGDIVPLHIAETAWCILSMFAGVIITALTIANLQRTIGQFDASRLKFQRKMELIKKFMKYRSLPNEIQDRVMSFYDYQWRVLRGADEEQFLRELPRTLQQQVTNHLCRDIIGSLPILRRANRALLNALVECSQMNIYSPHDEILKYGEQIRGALLVSQGEVEVLRVGNIERRMKRLDRFAQECLFVEKVSSHKLISKGFSEVIFIPRQGFQQVINSQCDKERVAEIRDSAFVLSRATTKANKMFGSGEDLTPTHGFKKHCHPNSFFRKLWDCIVLLGLIFYTFSIPLSFMHLIENTPIMDTPILLSVGYAIDLFFWVDTILQWNYFFYLESGIVVFDRDHIRQNYYQHHNYFREVVGLVPFDLVTCFLGGSYCHHFRLAKLVRLPNIAMYMESVEVMLSELKVDIDLALYRVIKLNILMLVVCHWCGCLWYMMASLSISLGHTQNWRQADENNELFSVSHADFGGFAAYLRSIYWAIVGMSTVGYGDIVPTNIIETTFATVVILFGGLVLPAVVGGLAAYISNLKVTAKLFQKRISKVRMYLIRSNVGDVVLDKVSRYYDYHWHCQGGVMEKEVMDELPLSLRNVVSAHINGTLINSLPFLRKCDENTKQQIASVLQPRVFIPADNIVQEGEQGVEMYFLKRGRVIVASSFVQAPLRILSTNDFFGESCLLRSSLSGATVKACTYCECYSLSRDDFKDAIAGSPFAEQVNVDLANLVIQAKHRNQRAIRNLLTRPKSLQITQGIRLKAPMSLVEPTDRKSRRLTGIWAREESELITKPSSTAWILPGSPFLLVWNSFLLCVCVYNALMIPYRLAFNTSDNLIIIDWMIDVLFVLDMLLNYCFVSYIQDGELIEDPQKIKQNYIDCRLKTDLISTFPFDLIAYFILPGWPVVWGLLRMLKMIRLKRHIGTLEKVFSFLLDHNISLAGLRLVEFLSGVILIAHWAACGFFLLARWKSSRANCSEIGSDFDANESASALAECTWEGTWIKKQINDGKLPNDGGETWQHYIRSFNWSLPTLVVVVIGDVVPTSTPETLYAFLLMAIGVTVNAAIVGNVANIVANLESDSSDFARRVEEIRNYMHKHHLSYDLHARVDDFTRYLWTAHRGSTNEDEFILRLPYSLQTGVIGTRTKLLLRCPFFDCFTRDTIEALALCLKPRQFCAADIIVHAGDFGQSMFFLETGAVQVVTSDGSTALATLRAGSFFGETSLFEKKPRASSICALTFCDVFELVKADLYSEVQQRDINLQTIMMLFARVSEKNSCRNAAIQKNLHASKTEGTKLNKIIDSRDDLSVKDRAILCIFMPGSLFRFIIDVTCMALIIYFSIFVIFRTAFRAEEDLRPVPFDIVADMFFVIDFYLRSSYFAFTRNGSICTDRRAILQQYMKSGMILDAVSSLSILEVLVPTLQLRLLSLLRVLRIPSFMQKIIDHLSLRGIRISLAANLLGKIILFYAIANHLVACIWFIIHRYIERKVSFTWATSDCPWGADVGTDGCLSKWNDTVGEHNICDTSTRDCYLRSLHFSLTTLSTVGYGDISPASELETIWENIVVLVGACFLAGLIGAFGTYLSERDTLGINSFNEKLQKLKDYMNYRKLDKKIQTAILFFHHCRWKDSQTLDERETLRMLPEPLQVEISFAVKRRVVQLVPILDALPVIVQKRIAHSLILQVYSQSEHPIIYSQGDIGWEIYFVASGVVSVSLPTDLSGLDATGRSNAAANKQKFDSIGLILGAGNHLGESCICSESGVRQETVTAVTTRVETYALSKEDLDGICRLMGSEKGSQFRHALLSRNNKNWHSFDLNVSTQWDGELFSPSIPWLTPKMGELATDTRSSMRRRRRKSSIGSPLTKHVLRDLSQLQDEHIANESASSSARVPAVTPSLNRSLLMNFRS